MELALSPGRRGQGGKASEKHSILESGIFRQVLEVMTMLSLVPTSSVPVTECTLVTALCDELV